MFFGIPQPISILRIRPAGLSTSSPTFKILSFTFVQEAQFSYSFHSLKIGCWETRTLRYLTPGKPTVFPNLPPRANQQIRVLDVN